MILRSTGDKLSKRPRKDDPLGYVRVIAALMPKELETRQSPYADVTDEELEAGIAAMRAILDAQGIGGSK